MRNAVVILLGLTAFWFAGPGRAGEKSEPAKVENLDKLNTEADEIDPSVLADNRTLLYASNAGKDFDIYLAHRMRISDDWPGGKPFEGLDRKGVDERSPHFFLDRRRNEKRIYFASNAVPEELADLKNFDLQFRGGLRSALPLPGISTKQDELHPWVTPGGTEFYFSRQTPGGWVLFVAKGPTFGGIADAKEVGFGPGYHNATLTSNGLTMYLQGPLDKKRTGIFRSTRSRPSSPWSKPERIVNLDDPRAKQGDRSPCLTFDGRQLYFVSDRSGGKGGFDLWSVPTAELKTE